MQNLQNFLDGLVKDHDLCLCGVDGLFPEGSPVEAITGEDGNGFAYCVISLVGYLSEEGPLPQTGQAFGAGLSLGAAIAAYAAERGFYTVIGGTGDEDSLHSLANPFGYTFTFIPNDHPEIENYRQ